ncbi:MAG: hypothetical protein Q8R92_20875 [Deltaproteobacteria bacterium]|nr:hypothetical protein [Deltaproteobacteria bacterium]
MGLKFGDKGTHTSRTMMLEELATVLSAVPELGTREDYEHAIVSDNCLGKPTGSTRRLSRQRLAELYALDPTVPLFRVLRRLWRVEDSGRPLLALLSAMARDPLLRATAPSVLSLTEGEEFRRVGVRDTLREAVGDRLNDSTLDKVVRNAASSWSQAGHLSGRTFKVRRRVHPTPATVAYALYLGVKTGFSGIDLFTSGWIASLDADPSTAREVALTAKRLGLIDLRLSDDIFQLNVDRLDPWAGKA